MPLLNYVKLGLAVYSWIIVGVLLLFLGRIAYFYEKTSRQRVRYMLYSIPTALLGFGALWYLFSDVEFVRQPVGDLSLFLGGVLVYVLGERLREMMTGERR
jgi:hypothetical protein